MAFSKPEALDLLARAHAHGRLAHAYLISGPRGSGKRDLVRHLAALIHEASPRDFHLTHPDIHVAEPESKSRRIVIDQIRELERELRMRSGAGHPKLAIVFDADRLVPAASNAFLKTLEEPPANSLLVLTTQHPGMLLDTIISRCIPVALRIENEPPQTPRQLRLVEALEAFFASRTAGLSEVYGLLGQFTAALRESREAIQKEHASELKKEEAHYAQATDGKWLDDREDYFKALTEAHYVEQRFTLVDTLTQWWADVLRHQQGSQRLDLPAHSPTTARLATEFSTAELLRRIAAVDELREHLGRNVHETLALEVGFLRAFSR